MHSIFLCARSPTAVFLPLPLPVTPAPAYDVTFGAATFSTCQELLLFIFPSSNDPFDRSEKRASPLVLRWLMQNHTANHWGTLSQYGPHSHWGHSSNPGSSNPLGKPIKYKHLFQDFIQQVKTKNPANLSGWFFLPDLKILEDFCNYEGIGPWLLTQRI